MRGILAAGALAALLVCAAPAGAVPAGEAITTPSAVEQHIQAAQDAADHDDWQKVKSELQPIVDTPDFRALAPDAVNSGLALLGVADVELHDYASGSALLRRATAMANTNGAQWFFRLIADGGLRDQDDTLVCIATLAQHWPDQLRDVDDRFLGQLFFFTRTLPEAREHRFEALSALEAINYTPSDPFVDPSRMWFDLSLMLIERGDVAHAAKAAVRVTNPETMVEIVSDKRFDAVVASDPAHYDVMAGVNQHVASMRAAVAAHPDRLSGVVELSRALSQTRQSAEALSIVENAMAHLHPGDGQASPYSDLDDQINWIGDRRSAALMNLHRVDEAVAEMVRSAGEHEQGGVNVSQAINLGEMYNNLARPADAIAELASFDPAHASPFGDMQYYAVEACAYAQLHDTAHYGEAATYLHAHKSDAPDALLTGLLCANDLDGAAQVLIEMVRDPETRSETLLAAQNFAEQAFVAPFELEMHQRRQALIARPDVRRAIDAVGRVRSYPRYTGIHD